VTNIEEIVAELNDLRHPYSYSETLGRRAADVIEQQSKDLAASIRMHEQARRLACAERDRAEVLETGILKALDLIESTDGLDVPAWSVHDILEAALDADADILIRWHSESFGPGTKQEGAQN